jgi:hypothetical protein
MRQGVVCLTEPETAYSVDVFVILETYDQRLVHTCLDFVAKC